jgi:sulfatase maturation enzyme AslB (radical SAM superfamily)
LKSITIYLNIKCNIDCEYCFVDKKHLFMDRPRLEKILRWFVEQEGQEKDINFLGGEPLLSADLLVGLKDFLRQINPGKRIQIKDIPTNGTLANEAMLERLKKEDIKLAFSLDGASFGDNKFRLQNEALFNKILKNIELYKNTYCLPRIKYTIHPTLVKNFDKKLMELINKGYHNIQIHPVFGILAWERDQVEEYRAGVNRLAQFYVKLLKAGYHGIQIHPLKDDIRRVSEEEYFDNAASCQMGSQPVFMPDGKAYTCELAMQYNNEYLDKKFSIGHIDEMVDLQKMRSLKSYKVCQDVPTDCTQTRPGACCRRVCFAYNLRTGKPFSPKEISIMLEMDSISFLAIKEVLTPRKELAKSHN